MKLTARQTEVAVLAARGLGYKAIARELGMSYHTARAHINTIAGRIPGEADSPLRKVMRWMLAGRTAA